MAKVVNLNGMTIKVIDAQEKDAFLSKDDLIDYLLEHCDDEPARSFKRGGSRE